MSLSLPHELGAGKNLRNVDGIKYNFKKKTVQKMGECYKHANSGLAYRESCNFSTEERRIEGLLGDS